MCWGYDGAVITVLCCIGREYDVIVSGNKTRGFWRRPSLCMCLRDMCQVGDTWNSCMMLSPFEHQAGEGNKRV